MLKNLDERTHGYGGWRRAFRWNSFFGWISESSHWEKPHECSRNKLYLQFLPCLTAYSGKSTVKGRENSSAWFLFWYLSNGPFLETRIAASRVLRLLCASWVLKALKRNRLKVFIFWQNRGSEAGWYVFPLHYLALTSPWNIFHLVFVLILLASKVTGSKRS